MPNRANEDNMPPPAVPSHDPLPAPPDIHYTRPIPQRTAPGAPHLSPRTVQENESYKGVGSGAVKLGSGLAAATTFAASIIAGFLIGQWVDHRWNHSGGLPWGTLVFSLAGVAAGFLNLFRVISATDRGEKKK